MIQIKNGNIVDSIPVNTNHRSIRSNFITCNCFDLETNQWVLITIDLRKPFERYIPEWMLKFDY